jgi:hypothetical protein
MDAALRTTAPSAEGMRRFCFSRVTHSTADPLGLNSHLCASEIQ